MEYNVRIEKASPRDVAVSRFEATGETIARLIGPAFGAVAADLGRRGIAITGPAVAAFDVRDDGFAVAAGFVVGEPVTPDGVVEPLALPAAEVATTVHVGPYEGLPEAYAAIKASAARHGRELDEHRMWEEYLDGPEVAPEKNRTVVSWPLQPA